MNAEEQLTAAVRQAAGSPRLILLHGPSGTGKTPALRNVAGRFDRAVINLGVSLSERLLPLPERARRLEVRRLLQFLAGSEAILFLDNVEVLFDPTLRADPYGCLDELARDRTVIAAWPTSVEEIAATTTLISTEEHL